MRGKAASPGIVIAPTLLINKVELRIARKNIQNPNAEIERLKNAVAQSQLQIENVRAKAEKDLSPNEVAVFDAHLMVLEDPELWDQTTEKIEKDHLNAEAALADVVAQFVAVFAALDDEYMRARGDDIQAVGDSILRNLLGIQEVDLTHLDHEVVLVADDLSAAQITTMDRTKVLGFLTNKGGRTSHVAILARTLEIPAVVGLQNITKLVQNGDLIAFNGDTGETKIRPDQETQTQYKKLKNDFINRKSELHKWVGKASTLKDGTRIILAGNIGTPEDLDVLKRNDAEAVGLFRTEFLFMDRSQMPTEDEQFTAYKKVLEGMAPKQVVIRTLDIGGDKRLPYLKLAEEENPFLGCRAIRLCLLHKDIFRTQLRALIRASQYGQLAIMYPMISNLEELLEVKAYYEQVLKEWESEGNTLSHKIEMGIMIEVPSAAIVSDQLARHVDFFSIGTNDLIQYTCAVDRMNESLQYLYSPYNPAVLRLIDQVVQNAHKENKWVGICGEMGGTPECVPLLIGLGLDELSMSPISILSTRKILSQLTKEDCVKIKEKVFTMSTATEIEQYLKRI